MTCTRKALSWLLILTLVAVLLAGCGNKKTDAARTPEIASPASPKTAVPSSESENSVPEEKAEAFSYEHDPQLNPSAMADIVADETAVYGFRPSETGSLKQYAEMDWSDPGVVEAGRQERLAYHDSFAEMYDLLGKMRAADKEIEEIARAVSTLRNELRMAAYNGDPEGLEAMKARNLEKYGHEEGPLPDELFEQYGSWEMVLEKSFSVNSGMDACLGLYDDYYDLYVLAGQVHDDDGV